jgi:surface protein
MSSLTNVSWQIDTSSQTTVNMSQMFSGCSSFADSDNNLQAWDVSGVSNFASLFPSCSFISPGIGGWNIGNATNLSGMFSNCTNFNVNLDNWVSSQISTITNMFSNTSFNNGLSSGVAGTCNISLNVPDAGGMFSGNNDINLKFPNLDFTNCTSIANLFPSCTSYNQSIEWINVTSTCTNFSRTFDGCSIFDQDLYYLETSGGTNFDRMLEDCTAFNNGGNTLQNVFRPASGIDPFRQVFKNCTSFNQAIPNLRTENATHLTNVFNNCIAFNQDLSYLQTGNATDMTGMFTGCTVFDQDLTYWNVSGVGVEPTDFSTASALNTANKPIWGSAPSFGLIMEVDTTLADLTPAGQFQIDVTDFNPTSSDPITVEWGDGNSDVAVANGTLSHTYGASAVYEVNITGTGAFTNLNQDKLKIDKLKWGPDFIPTSLNQAFEGATNITQSLGEPSWAQFTGTLNRTYYSNSSLSLVSSWSPVNALIYSSLFFDCSTLERVNWYFDTSGATNSVSFNGMFENCTTFNDYIRGWDLSANGFQFQMSQMFNGCTNFNNSGRPLKLTFNNLANFEGAFQNCTNFVGDGLETWTWSPAGTIQSIQLFNGCNNLDCDLSSWDVSAFDAWQQVFQNCFKINFSIDSWSNSTASSALNIFSTARDWNNGNPAGQLNTCTASLIFTGNCVNAFSNNWVMNCNFTNLDTTTVTDFGSYFQNCFALTVSSNLSFAAATSTSSFFSGCTLINDPAIASYNMSGVQNMSFMFDSTGAFNQDISGWVTNSALFMDAMFQSCAAFDQDISGWNVNSVTSATNFSLSATERGNGNWIEAEHPSNGALGSFFNT